ncbi:MAG: sigma-54 dependent transcriptional regulator [Thermodesulfobacteriota bacterium]|nr:sigma-54 dependent transcriptional regulator [Desulfovibrionales bacterium]MDQ7838553.1 sigma-54 dependent transcriptional regulator [Thermodesulfobacteriota bacterium]
MESILIVDDEKNYLIVLKELLSEENYEVVTAENAPQALEIFKESDFDLVLTDMKMPNMDGIELLENIRSVNSEIPVIVMTAYATVEKAVKAMKKGAFDYVTKPFQNEELKITVRKAIDLYKLRRENLNLRHEVSRKYQFGNIIGKSPAMLKLYEMIEKVADTKATVLITGETGTGKELVAKAVHYNSPRKNNAFVSVNCAAIPETLLESELFGHEKGSFTGAIAMRKGRFELADGGTIFLDEIAEMPAALQAKLLRALQEMEFERVGGTKTLKIDVRVIAASNKDPKKEVETGNLREDLYYRLNVVRLHLPPLRERPGDIPLLAAHFLNKYGQAVGKSHLEILPAAMRQLYTRSWPGNVRELEHVIERAVILASGHEITPADMASESQEAENIDLDIDRFIPMQVKLNEALEDVEAKMIKRALARAGNVQAHAAAMLGITKSLLQYKMKKYNI